MGDLKMADLEKVIKGLECCILRDPDDKLRCSECPYEGNCVNRLKQDTLSLLKAQEPKSPRFTVAYDKIFYACDNCGKSLVVMANSEGLVLQQHLPKYCSECGQAVKWDG